jgi:hypothetical protein
MLQHSKNSHYSKNRNLPAAAKPGKKEKEWNNFVILHSYQQAEESANGQDNI